MALIVYRRWFKVKYYEKLVNVATVPGVKNMLRDVVCDGWFLFGKLPLVIRENI